MSTSCVCTTLTCELPNYLLGFRKNNNFKAHISSSEIKKSADDHSGAGLARAYHQDRTGLTSPLLTFLWNQKIITQLYTFKQNYGFF